jgi:arylsulfatase A-like enzyme
MGKGWNYEGGIREPLLVLWPGVTKPGSISEQPVISTDFYPTFLEMAGEPPRPYQHVDGLSIASALRGQILPARYLYWHYPHYSNQLAPPGGAIRLGEFKLIEPFETMQAELYNLKDDPGEHHDLSLALPDKTKALLTQLHTWRASVNAQMPTPNPNYDPNWKPPAKKPSPTE